MPIFTDDELLRATIQGQINAEEVKQFRVIREYLLGDPSAIAKLRGIDDNIAALRPKLPKEK